MIRIAACEGGEELRALLAREDAPGREVTEAVSEILAAVRARGDEALFEYERRFDGAELASLEVSPGEIEEAYAATDPQFLSILALAKRNITEYHEKQRRQGFELRRGDGVVMGQRVIPLDRVGVYVPGGTASYPSTVLMDILPAKIAGVGEVVMASPPGRDGRITPDILAAAKIAGADRVFKLGGAQAVAALCYGTGSVPRADKIVGPGNIYVATAKRLVYGLVDIDMIAGPSDVLIISDGESDPACLAADMLAQAEHDPLAAARLVTTSRKLAEAVAEEIERQLKELPRRELARESIERGGLILVADTLERAAELSNHIAPEHLELCVEEPFALLPLIRHAGSVFLGRDTPEALGDYLAGPNHTLPTMGTARFSSPLSVDDFVKKFSYLCYDRQALAQVSAEVAAFARREGLAGHARSVEIRMEKGEK